MLRYSHIEKEEAEEMYLTYTKQRRSCEINIVVDLNTAYTEESPTESFKNAYTRPAPSEELIYLT